nr:dynamin family protein [Sphaerisporangium rubeum]
MGDGRLWVAVGGQINAGKSTLVNALLGRDVAPTGETECTFVVARYMPSHQDRVVVTPRVGDPYEVLTGPRGGLPVRDGGLGRAPGEVAWVDVEFSGGEMPLACVLVDTPGLNSPNHDDDGSIAALGDADAVLYVMPHPGEDDAKAFMEIRDGVDASLAGRSGRIGVISQVDRLPKDPRKDPWTLASQLAATYGERLRAEVSAVVPVVGLLAETALGAEFTERDAELVRLLARHDPGEVYEALYDDDEFRHWEDGPLEAGERSRLLGMLGIHGLCLCVEHVRNGAMGSYRLLAHLRERSGVDRLVETVRSSLGPRTDWLRAASALTRLTEAAWRDRNGEWLLDAVEELRRLPVFARGALREALWEVESGRLRLDAGDVEALRLLVSRASPGEALGLPPGAGRADVARAAGWETTRWRYVEQDPTRPPRLRRFAGTARRLCEGYHPDMRR